MSDKSKAPWLGRPITWAAVVLAGLIGSIMTFSYLGGFLDPVGELDGAPVAFIDEDAGANIAGNQIDLGQMIQKELSTPGQNQFDWQILKSQKEAERRLRDNDLWGAIVVPRTFSADVGNIALAVASPGAQAPPQAKVTVLTNEGAGLFQPTVFTKASQFAITTTSNEARAQLVGVLDQAQITISPEAASTLGEPVVAEELPIVMLPEKSGRGMAPFYLAVMVTLTGFLAASIANIAIDLQRGAEKLEIFGREIDLNVGDGGAWVLWRTKALLTVLGAALGGLLAMLTAVGILKMDVASAPMAYGLGALGAVCIGLVSLVFLTLFGIAGELVGVLFTTIFGVPSALGVYPSQAVPGIFSWIGSWHPLRYLTDSLRSVAFFDASGAGLGRGVTVLAVWLVGAIVVGGLVARLQDRPARAHAARPVLQS